MRPILPRPERHELPRLARFVFAIALSACAHPQPPVPPGEPIPAEPDTKVASIDKECAGVVTAIDTYSACPNLEEPQRDYWRRVSELSARSFATTEDSTLDPKGARAIAVACHRAATAITFANERCMAGKPPLDR